MTIGRNDGLKNEERGPLESTSALLRRADRAFKEALRERLARHDVALSLWFVLSVLKERDGRTPKELSAVLRLREPTTVGALDRLAERGLVERRPNSADRRSVHVHLTPAGRSLHGALAPIAAELEQIALGDFDEQEEELLRAYLQRLTRNVGDAA